MEKRGGKIMLGAFLEVAGEQRKSRTLAATEEGAV